MQDTLRQFGLATILAPLLFVGTFFSRSSLPAAITVLPSTPLSVSVDAPDGLIYALLPAAAPPNSSGGMLMPGPTQPDHIVGVSLADGRIVADRALGPGILTLAADPQHHRIYAGDTFGGLSMMDARRGLAASRIVIPGQWVASVLPLGATRLAVALDLRGVALYDTRSWQPLGLWRLGAVTAMVSGEGGRLAYIAAVPMGSQPGGLALLDTQNGRLRRVIDPGSRPTYLYLDEARCLLIVADQAGGLTILDSRTLRRRAVVPTGPLPGPFAYDPRTARLWVANRLARSIQLIDVSTGRNVATLALSDQPAALAVDGASARTLIATDGGDLLVASTRTGRRVRTLTMGGNGSRQGWSVNAAQDDPQRRQVIVTADQGADGVCAIVDMRHALLARRAACPLGAGMVAVDPVRGGWVVVGGALPPAPRSPLRQALDLARTVLRRPAPSSQPAAGGTVLTLPPTP